MIVLLAVVGVALLVTLLLVFNRPLLFIYALAASVFGQNIVTMLLLRSGIVSVQDGVYLLYLKELILLFGLAYLGLGRLLSATLHLNWVDMLALVYLLFLGMLFPLETAIPLEIRVAGIRSLALLPTLYLLGRWLHHSRFDLSSLSRLFVDAAILFALFGLLEALILPETFWLAIGHEEFYLMKEGRIPRGSLYLNMYFWDLGSPIRRIASITGDPLLSSYTMLYGTLLLGFWMRALYPQKLRVGHLVALVTLAATVLTFSRGAVVSLLTGVITLALSLQNSWIFGFLLIVGTLSVVSVVWLFGDTLLEVFSGLSHVEGLQSGLAAGLDHPFGIGIGLSSNVAANRAGALGELQSIQAGGDSFLGSVAAQIGIIGAILAYSVFFAIVICLYQQRKHLRQAGAPQIWFYTATISILTGLVFTSVVNESGFSYSGSGLIFMASGLLVSSAKEYLTRRVSEKDGASIPLLQKTSYARSDDRTYRL